MKGKDGKYPILSLQLGGLQNNLHPYPGHVKNHQPRGAPAHPNGHTERLFIKGPEFPHSPVEKLLPSMLRKFPKYFLWVMGRFLGKCSTFFLCHSQHAPHLPRLPTVPALRGGAVGGCWATRALKGWCCRVLDWLCSQWPWDLVKVILLSLSFLICENKGFLLNDLYGTSQLPGSGSSGSILRSFTEWPWGRMGSMQLVMRLGEMKSHLGT